LPAQVWKIPVRLARGKVTSTALLDEPQRTLDVGRCGERGPLVVNAGGAGFYRVAYEPKHLQDLTQRFGELSGVDRVTLVSDTFALMQAGHVPMASYFSLLAALGRIDDASAAMLWTVASRQLEFLDTALAGTPAQPQLRAAARKLLAPQLARLGWKPRPKEDAQAGQFRAMLIEHLAQFDDEPTVQEAMRRFDDDEAARAPLPASMRAAVVIAAGIHADRARFDQLLVRLKAADAEEDRWLYAHALTAGREPARVAELLSLSLAGVTPANVASAVPGMVARHSPFGEQAYRFTVDNWKRLAELAGNSGSSWLLPNAARAFNDAGLASRLIEDQQRAAGPDGLVLAARQAEDIRLRAAVKAREATSFGSASPGGAAGG
jgi:aminopeptidase N